MNAELARFNMIEQQIRPWDVLDDRVLSLLRDISRDSFVPAGEERLAFADVEVPLGHGQFMWAPKVEARMLQALNPRSNEVALEIGTGSGYVTALLGKLCKHVYSVDYYADFTASARAKLARLNYRNVTIETGDAANGWSKHAPYDLIAATGSYPVFPEALQQQLKIGGRLFVIVGEAPIMEALLITRTAENAWQRDSLFETSVEPILNFVKPQKFVF